MIPTFFLIDERLQGVVIGGNQKIGRCLPDYQSILRITTALPG
jgi:hypothetical protein